MYLMVISQLISSTCLTEIRNKSVNLLLKKFDNLRKIFLKIITKNKNKKKTKITGTAFSLNVHLGVQELCGF